MDIVTYAMAMNYVKRTCDGMGYLKGSPCTIKSITEVDGGNNVTFEWTGNSGAKQTRTMFVKDGDAGVSVTSAEVDSRGHLILTLSDMTQLDCGLVTGNAKLTQALTPTEDIGSIKGKTYPAGTNIEQVIRDICIRYQAPAITLTTTPATKLYDIVTDSISTILLKASVTKKTNNVTKVSFYRGDTVVNEVTTGVASGGNFQYQYTPSTSINTDVTFKATATDGKQTTTSTYVIKFVGRSYYGICDPNTSEITETIAKSGSSVLKDTKAWTYSNINADYNKVFYVYPKAFGELSKIFDPVNNINYMNSFDKNSVEIDGIAYWAYVQRIPSQAIDVKIDFS